MLRTLPILLFLLSCREATSPACEALTKRASTHCAKPNDDRAACTPAAKAQIQQAIKTNEESSCRSLLDRIEAESELEDFMKTPQ